MNFYEYFQDDSEFRFTSSFGLTYLISFDPEGGELFVQTTSFRSYDNKVYWLVVWCSAINPSYDPVAGNTICEIIRVWLEEHNHIIYFICNNSDNKGFLRHHKFKRWAAKFYDQFQYDDLQSTSPMGITYSGIVVRKDASWYDQYCKDFEIFKLRMESDLDK